MEIKNLNDAQREFLYHEIIELISPEWINNSKNQTKFSNRVLTSHSRVENLLNVLIAVKTFGSKESQNTIQFIDVILAKLDFCKKVQIVQELALLEKKTISAIYELNNFRVSQSHVKKNDPKRENSPENTKRIKELTENIVVEIGNKIFELDKEWVDKIRRVLNSEEFINYGKK